MFFPGHLARIAMCVNLVLVPQAVFAQSATGEIDISVLDATTQKPVADARTILLGSQTASSLTTASGNIRYTDVPIGIYRIRVVRAGYIPSASTEFDVLPNRAVQVHVELATQSAKPPAGATTDSSGLKVIATTITRAKVSITSTDISANSPIRRLSDSLTDALDKISGVTVTSDSTDPNSAVTVSLHNQDESQTSLSLDGIPLSAPGSAGNLRGIGSDLFSGSSVSFGPQAGALGGGVSFRTLEPTQALQIRASGTTGSFDRSNYSLAATGSLGSLGFAAQHTWRGANTPLTFQNYLDQSGLDYMHEGYSNSLGDLLKVRYRLGDERTSVGVTTLSNNREAWAICARDVTIVPCGIGPNNDNYGRYALASANVQSLIGNISTQFSAYANTSNQYNNDANRYYLDPLNDYQPTLSPSTGNNNTTTRGLSYSASIAEKRHTFSLSGNLYSSVSANTPTAGSQFVTAFTNAATSTTYRLGDSYKMSDKWTLSPAVSLVNTTGLGTSALAGVGATFSPKPSDAFSFSVNVGSSVPNLSGVQSFSDPNSARFDCQAQTAIVSAPGDTGGGSQSAFNVNGTWSHQFRSGATASINVFSQLQSGQLINALIKEPSSIYPEGYLATLATAYRAPLVCGADAPLPAVFANVSVAGTQRLYQGFDFNTRFALGRNVVVIPSYSLNLAKLTAASARLQDGPSTTIVGAQLPNRPIHRGGVTVDGLLPRSGVELLANAQYTGSNNQQNIGPYVIVNAGISHRFGPGQITLFENNMFNTYGGSFATDQFARPLPLSDGTLLRTAGTPLQPRAFFLSYSTAIGGPLPGPSFAGPGGRALAQDRAPAPSASASPARGLRLAPFPPPPGVDPLAAATARPSCDAESQTAAAPVLADLRAFVTAYEAHQTKLPPVANLTVTPHVASADPAVAYYLELRPNVPRPPAGASPISGPPTGGFPGGPGGVAPGGEGPGAGGHGGPPIVQVPPGTAGASGSPFTRAANSPQLKAFRGFIGCAYVTLWTATEAKANGIPLEGGRPGLFYVPHVGIVAVRPPELPQGGGSLKQTK